MRKYYQMSGQLSEDGSISTHVQSLLNQLEQTTKSTEIRAEALKNDQARLDAFMSNIKWMLSVVGALIIAAFAGVGYLGFASISDVEKRVTSSAETTVDRRIQFRSENGVNFARISEEYDALEEDYETYRTWADALLAVTSETELGARDSRHAYLEVSELSMQDELDQEDRLRALALLESLVVAGTNGDADPNDLFNAGVSASRLGMNREASQLAVLASNARRTVSHRAFELQMEDLFGISYTFDNLSKELSEVTLAPQEVRKLAWTELMAMLSLVPRIEAEQAYSRASNVAVRNRSEGYFEEMIAVIETSSVEFPDRMNSYAYQTLATLYAWESKPGWEANFWRNVENALTLLQFESPSTTWVEHSARELLKEASRINELPRLMDLATKYNVDLVLLGTNNR